MTLRALITGGGSGFGEEVARQLVRRGDSCVLVDVDAARGQAVADELGQRFLQADVSSFDEVVATTAEAESLLGGIDVAFLNAGVSTGCGIADDFDLERYRRANGVNLDGVVFGMHAVIPALRRSGGGSIVATASMAGLTGVPFDPVYGANKHAVVGLVRAMGQALAHERIRVNAFCPGFAETRIIHDIKEHLVGSGVPIIPVEQAGRSVLEILDSTETGQAWLLQAGHEVQVYRFRGIPGPKTDTGEAAGALDPTTVPPL